MKDVLEAIEGTYYFSRCLPQTAPATEVQTVSAVIRKAFNEISEMVRNKLDIYLCGLIANSEEFNREDTANETQQEIQS